MQSTHETIVGIFANRARADQAVSALNRAGFDEVGVVARDLPDGKGIAVGMDGTAEEENVAAGATTGAALGAAGGALIGAGIITGVIPVIGPVLAIGTLGTILLNAAGGAAIAGIAGALIGWGISEEDARYYESEVKAGKYLVTVQADGRVIEARDILEQYDGYDRSGIDSSEMAAATR
jgi:hypothetical protein